MAVQSRCPLYLLIGAIVIWMRQRVPLASWKKKERVCRLVILASIVIVHAHLTHMAVPCSAWYWLASSMGLSSCFLRDVHVWWWRFEERAPQTIVQAGRVLCFILLFFSLFILFFYVSETRWCTVVPLFVFFFCFFLFTRLIWIALRHRPRSVFSVEILFLKNKKTKKQVLAFLLAARAAFRERIECTG